MDFLDPKKKRAHNTRLAVGYGLIFIIICLATAIVALMVILADTGLESTKTKPF